MTKTESQLQKELMVEWCSLLTGYSTTYFEQKSDEDLLKEYIGLMANAADKIMSNEVVEKKGRNNNG